LFEASWVLKIFFKNFFENVI